MSRDFDWPEFLFLLGALRWTIVLSLIAFVGGGIGGLVLALARTSSHTILRWLAAGYIGLMQGTPVLMQLFLAYYGLAVLTGIRIDPWPAVTLAFTMYAAAFLGEIWRGAIQAIPRQQWEAAAAIPLAPAAQLRYVILPQAFRIAIPPTVGFLVQLIKGTSIASIHGPRSPWPSRCMRPHSWARSGAARFRQYRGSNGRRRRRFRSRRRRNSVT